MTVPPPVAGCAVVVSGSVRPTMQQRTLGRQGLTVRGERAMG
ncbi:MULTISPECIES: hypothetical protein [unclassified Curtobacterium]|nr:MULTISPECIES: hypothetical protein [unclassified Curtobacterium]